MSAEFIKPIFEALRERPEAALAAVAILAPLPLIALDVNPYLSILAALAIYLAYCMRSVWDARSKVRLAELEVEKIQAQGDMKIARLAERQLDRIDKVTE